MGQITTVNSTIRSTYPNLRSDVGHLDPDSTRRSRELDSEKQILPRGEHRGLGDRKYGSEVL